MQTYILLIDGKVQDIYRDTPEETIEILRSIHGAENIVEAPNEVAQDWIVSDDGISAPIVTEAAPRSYGLTDIEQWAESKFHQALAGIPEAEKVTWDLQTEEATKYLADQNYQTVLLASQAAVTGETILQVAQKVLGKKAQLAAFSGATIGVRRQFTEKLKQGEAFTPQDMENALNMALMQMAGLANSD